MDSLHELSFRPADELERQEFESVLHDFVALESRKPLGDTSSVYARYDAPAGRWVLGFETHTALQGFKEHWRAHVSRLDQLAQGASAPRIARA